MVAVIACDKAKCEVGCLVGSKGMQDRADVRIMPPVILIAALGLGFVARAHFDATILPSELAEAIGFLTIGASIFFVFSAFRELQRAKTAFDVRKPTQSLVETGVFALSRNPVYLSMVLLYIGAAFLMNSFWMLLLFLPTGSALCLAVIRWEERYLEDKFGETYRAYRRRVRRWI
jgi:protein-S-isoprenylcysteine O-methyltransferase Ste14